MLEMQTKVSATKELKLSARVSIMNVTSHETMTGDHEQRKQDGEQRAGPRSSRWGQYAIGIKKNRLGTIVLLFS